MRWEQTKTPTKFDWGGKSFMKYVTCEFILSERRGPWLLGTLAWLMPILPRIVQWGRDPVVIILRGTGVFHPDQVQDRWYRSCRVQTNKRMRHVHIYIYIYICFTAGSRSEPVVYDGILFRARVQLDPCCSHKHSYYNILVRTLWARSVAFVTLLWCMPSRW